MLKAHSRTQRVTQEIKKKIAVILQHKIKDPRISMMTVSNVRISRDLMYARVFVTFLNKKTSKQIKDNIQVLQDAAGFIRSLLSKTLPLRVVPALIFVYDDSIEEGMRMTNLINQVVQNDLLRRCKIRQY